MSMKRIAQQTDAMPLSAATTYTGAEETTTWDEAKIYGCVCDSSWTVGLTSGATQQSEFFGPDCSLKRCPSADDPLTEEQAVTSTIHSEGSNYDADADPVSYAAANVLTDDSGDVQGKYWLTPDGANSWFILTFGSALNTNRGTITSTAAQPFRVSKFKFRNTKNSLQATNVYPPRDLRTTTGYTIELSVDASSWTTVFTGTMNPYDMTTQEVAPSSDMQARYARFSTTAFTGVGGGLSYFQVFVNDNEEDCSYVVAEGGLGTGVFANKCHKECAGE
jgi:hypothetical protein